MFAGLIIREAEVQHLALEDISAAARWQLACTMCQTLLQVGGTGRVGCNASQDILLEAPGLALMVEDALLRLNIIKRMDQNQNVWLRSTQVVCNALPKLQPAQQFSAQWMWLTSLPQAKYQ